MSLVWFVFLKDPPYFNVRPGGEYRQEAGRELVIPCAASGDPDIPSITWRKVLKTFLTCLFLPFTEICICPEFNCITVIFMSIEGGEAKQEQAQHPTQWQLTVCVPQQGRPRRMGVCSHQCGHEHHCQHAYPSHRYSQSARRSQLSQFPPPLTFLSHVEFTLLCGSSDLHEEEVTLIPQILCLYPISLWPSLKFNLILSVMALYSSFKAWICNYSGWCPPLCWNTHCSLCLSSHWTKGIFFTLWIGWLKCWQRQTGLLSLKQGAQSLHVDC